MPLPEELPPLPDVEEVEGLFYGVPAHRLSLRRTRPRRSPCFDTFIHHFPKFGGPEDVTAAEWAAWVGQPVKVVRRRLRRLARWGPLVYARKTKRYAVRRVESPIDSPPAPGEAANPTPASNSAPSPKSQGEQAKSSAVQPSNESGGDTSGADGTSSLGGESRGEPVKSSDVQPSNESGGGASTGSLAGPPLQPRSPLAPESRGSPDTPSVPEPTATKLPPPARGS